MIKDCAIIFIEYIDNNGDVHTVVTTYDSLDSLCSSFEDSAYIKAYRMWTSSDIIKHEDVGFSKHGFIKWIDKFPI
jgi:hypothetical protein